MTAVTHEDLNSLRKEFKKDMRRFEKRLLAMIDLKLADKSKGDRIWFMIIAGGLLFSNGMVQKLIGG